MAHLTARWHKVLENEILQRSSQILSAVGSNAYIFGGELRPREPRDNDVHVVPFHSGATVSSKPASSASPTPRVGAAATTLNGKIYLFSGRGGIAMAPIEEQGAIWEYDPTPATWTAITPSSGSSYPAARSYHCAANDGADTIYIHAGCPEKGRLSDLWAFNLARKEWTELAPAPDPARGGTSIAFAGGKIYRMNGFDGKTEQGGNVDVYSPDANSWSSISYAPDGKEGPFPRSVSVLLPIVRDDTVFLVTMFGERDPSSLGHQGAGKMLGDAWAFNTTTKTWSEVRVEGDELPAPRGWFDADVVGHNAIVVHGGLGESNDRLGDVWKLEFS